jgi:hypothetical protein
MSSSVTLPRGFFVVLLSALLAACSSHSDAVCQDVGDCAHGGDTSWITRCQTEANALGAEAADAGCSTDFNGYYACDDSKYSCQGATALFPGCDDSRAALDACLAAATAGSACVRLTSKEAVCASPGAGPDAGTDGGLAPACTSARDCETLCYLDAVADVCAPRVDELQQVTTCAASCPP